jgi:hypothetical protein
MPSAAAIARITAPPILPPAPAIATLKSAMAHSVRGAL